MKAGELAKLLMEHPDDEVLVRSTNPEMGGEMRGSGGLRRFLAEQEVRQCRDMMDGTAFSCRVWRESLRGKGSRMAVEVEEKSE